MKRNFVYGISSSILAFLVLGIPTDLIPNDFFKRMTPITIFDYIFLLLVPILFGISIFLYAKNKQSRKKTCVVGGGLVSGWLAVICPICTSFLVYVFGASFLLTYFDPIRPLFGAFSVMILGLLIYLQKKN